MLLDPSKVQYYRQRSGFEWYSFSELVSYICFNSAEICFLQWNIMRRREMFHQIRPVRVIMSGYRDWHCGIEEFAYHRLYKAHKHSNKRTIYREYRSTSYRDLYTRKIQLAFAGWKEN